MKKFLALILIFSLVIIPCDFQSALATTNDVELKDDSAQEINFTSLSDPALLQYVEDSVYANLENEFASDDYIIEDISVVYISKEYLEELNYNSKENIYFGYTLSELDAWFDGNRYVFSLGDDGQTTVKAFESIDDDTYAQVLKNVAIGTGVILICVTVSVITGGLAAPAAVTASATAKASVIFAASAKTAAALALKGGTFAAVSAGVVTGIETQNFDSAIKAAALAGSEGFKWGAISGAVVGGAGKAIELRGLNGQIPTFQEAEQAAEKMYGGDAQASYLEGKLVAQGTPGSTRPDIIRNVGGVLEAIEVKRYDLAANMSMLKRELSRQVSQRCIDLPKGSLQRIVLNVEGRGYTKQFVQRAIVEIQSACSAFYPNIPVEAMGAML